ncbi:MAG: class I SAM-dependent methyltransferase [Gammaproteobacteria bacterium]|nr:class I SAM-dependent methyltransferase [Gammaproteobacteria bacterium]
MSTSIQEHPPCPLCGADSPLPGKEYVFEPFRVVQCTACKLWYLSPRLREEEMLKAYADPLYLQGGGEYGYSNPRGTYLDQEDSLRKTFRRFVQALHKKRLTGGHLLEIGCGYGFLLAEAQAFFQSVTGADFDERAVARVRESGSQAIQGGIDDLPLGKQYDLIVSASVIEHVYRPLDFVKKLREFLTYKGWMVFATPQMNSFWLKLQGQHWPSFKIPEHVAYYDRDTLCELFHRCGALQTKIIPYPAAYPLGTIAAKLGFPLPGWLTKRSLWLPATMFAVGARFDK